MADAKICDRCGNFYQTHGVNGLQSTDKLNIFEDDINHERHNSKFFDLCPNCRQELDNWLKGMKEKT
jgi:hypothetical protein